MVAVREAPEVFVSTITATVPSPAPDVPVEILTQSRSGRAIQLQPGCARTSKTVWLAYPGKTVPFELREEMQRVPAVLLPA